MMTRVVVMMMTMVVIVTMIAVVMMTLVRLIMLVHDLNSGQGADTIDESDTNGQNHLKQDPYDCARLHYGKVGHKNSMSQLI